MSLALHPTWIAAVSGKGGVGKTNVVANLALAAAGLGARALVVDGDLGLANVDVLLGLSPSRSVVDALAGRCTLADAIVTGPRGIGILPAGSARPDLAAPTRDVLDRFLTLLHDAAAPYDLVLLDAGAGVGPAMAGLAGASARTLVVTTPEPTSLADAYAALKVLRRDAPGTAPCVLVNAAGSARAAHRTHACLDALCRRFLDTTVAYRGWLPSDPFVRAAVEQQKAVVEAFPSSRWARAIVALAEQIVRERARSRPAPRPAAALAPPAAATTSGSA